MIRTLALAGGLLGAAALSQYPEFAQQYLQRLGGQVDALTIIVDDFEASAMEAGLTRTEALAETAGTTFLDQHRSDLLRTFRRHAVLSDDLEALRTASPLQRILMPQRIGDPATFAATWGDFRPAMPLTVAGIASAAVGLALGWLVSRILLALLVAPLRRRQTTRRAGPRRAAAGPRRTEPALLRPAGAGATPMPRLSGVRRDR